MSLDRTLRRIQGHRRLSGADRSVELYGRDDIRPMLDLQVINHVRAGFRPLQPLARGSSTPLPVDPSPVSDFSALPLEDSAPSPVDSVSSASASRQRIRGLRLMLLRPLPRIQCLLHIRSPSHQPCLIMIWPPRLLVSIFIITALMWCMLLGRRFPLTRPAHRTHSVQSSFTALHVVHALTVTAWNLSAVPCLRPLLHACTVPVVQPCPLKV